MRVVLAPATELEALLETDFAAKVGNAEAPSSSSSASAEDLERLHDLAEGAPVVRWIDQLLETAVTRGASDIHLEPVERAMRVRLRVDGKLQVLPLPTPASCDALISRIKILAKLNIAERRLPQDGRMKSSILGKDVDFRVATTPSLHGEGAVIRLLMRSGALLSLDELGMSSDATAAIRAAIRKPNGITLVAGPTGSGKTTTLYAALRDIVSSELKLVSVEDPVEYEIDGVSQIQVRPNIGLDFARSLRSILRQDPDVLMIGEIRDRETATIAIEAALTGHTVLSTIHTNSAPATVSRLLEMGVPNYLISSTLSAVIAQRLVRKLCENCAQPTPAPPEFIQLASDSAIADTPAFRVGAGCTQCAGTGFKGRLSVAEVMTVTKDIRAGILTGSSEDDIRRTAQQQGMRPLAKDGLLRAARGQTTIEEVLGVTGGLADA